MFCGIIFIRFLSEVPLAHQSHQLSFFFFFFFLGGAKYYNIRLPLKKGEKRHYTYPDFICSFIFANGYCKVRLVNTAKIIITF